MGITESHNQSTDTIKARGSKSKVPDSSKLTCDLPKGLQFSPYANGH